MVEFREDMKVISNIDRILLPSSYAQKICLVIAKKYSIKVCHSRRHTYTHKLFFVYLGAL